MTILAIISLFLALYLSVVVAKWIKWKKEESHYPVENQQGRNFWRL